MMEAQKARDEPHGWEASVQNTTLFQRPQASVVSIRDPKSHQLSITPTSAAGWNQSGQRVDRGRDTDHNMDAQAFSDFSQTAPILTEESTDRISSRVHEKAATSTAPLNTSQAINPEVDKALGSSSLSINPQKTTPLAIDSTQATIGPQDHMSKEPTTTELRTRDPLVGGTVADGSKWRPDAYVNAFIPDSFLAINQSRATPVFSAPLEGVNFPQYIQTFAGTHLLSPVKELKQDPSFSGKIPMMSIGQIDSNNYGQHLLDCMALDLKAQAPEMRSYDLFGVQLVCVDPSVPTYQVHVPGIREGTPQIALGNTVLLRQLLFDPNTGLPLGMDIWLAWGGFARNIRAPGFTGYVLHAVVVAIDKKAETLIIRANGFVPELLRCNVSFVISSGLIQSLHRAVLSVAQEFAEHHGGTSVSAATRSWLQRMLFPQDADGILQTELPPGVFAQEWVDQSLNYEQRVRDHHISLLTQYLMSQQKAADVIQSMKHHTAFLIHGPPGTGKTKTICEAVNQLAKDPEFQGSILLCAPSDPAADMLAMRLRANFSPGVLFRLNNFTRDFAEVPQEILSYCYVERDFFSLPPFATLMAFKVVVTTCQSADILVQACVTNRDLAHLEGSLRAMIHPVLSDPTSKAMRQIILHWGALIIDEAAQATEIETLIPLCVVAPTSGHSLRTNDASSQRKDAVQDPIFVMAGDQHQLGPRTYSKATTLHISLFERLSTRPLYASHPLVRSQAQRKERRVLLKTPWPPLVTLIRNYRSHPAILAVPSSLFYKNSLIPEATDCDSLLPWNKWRGRRWPVLFACNGGMDECEDLRASGGAGWYNVREAHLAIHYAQDLLASGLIQNQPDICIMSPFRAQVRILRAAARDLGLWDLNIGPMEAFQGLESQAVIICTTRARSRFLDPDRIRGIGLVGEPKKFNVTLTRAKKGLVVLGNPWVLATDACWLAFLRFCWRNGLWEQDRSSSGPMMEGHEGRVNEWAPPKRDDGGEAVQGLEAALVYKENEPWTGGSRAVQRFMGESVEDRMYRLGLEAEAEVEY